MNEWSGLPAKRVVITGATNGIGMAAAQELHARGAHLSVVARSQKRGEDAVAAVTRAGGDAPVDVLVADLSSQAEVRNLAATILERYPRIDVLVNNAGAVFGTRELTVDGIEMTWAVNHLAPFLLTTLLLERLTASAPARVITTTSDAHKNMLIPFDDINAEHGYPARGFRRYGQTKLANILFTVELAKRLAGTGATANCFHPGLVATGFNRNNGALMRFGMKLVRPISRSPKKGAETLVWLADSADVSDDTGGYFIDCRRATPSKAAQDADAAARLWAVSEKQVS